MDFCFKMALSEIKATAGFVGCPRTFVWESLAIFLSLQTSHHIEIQRDLSVGTYTFVTLLVNCPTAGTIPRFAAALFCSVCKAQVGASKISMYLVFFCPNCSFCLLFIKSHVSCVYLLCMCNPSEARKLLRGSFVTCMYHWGSSRIGQASIWKNCVHKWSVDWRTLFPAFPSAKGMHYQVLMQVLD